MKIAAVNALGAVGSAVDVATLTGLLTIDDADIADAAKVSLTTMQGEAVNVAIADIVPNVAAPLRVQLLALLADRGAEQTVPMAVKGLDDTSASVRTAALTLLAEYGAEQMLPMAVKSLGDSNASVRIAALRALARRGGVDQAPTVVATMQQTTEASEQAAAEKALLAICSRSGDRVLPIILVALQHADPESRAALLRALGRIGGPEALKSVVTALEDSNEQIRYEAVRVLSNWTSLDAKPHLLKLARSDELKRHVLGLRGYVRLALIEPSGKEKAHMLNTAMSLAKQPSEKRRVVSGWETLPTEGTLDELVPLLDDADVRNEAAYAIIRVAAKLDQASKKPAIRALKAALNKCERAEIRERARDTMERFTSEGQAREPTRIHSGLISGAVLDTAEGLQVFRGIPYAAPPVGALRWRAPQDAAPWDGVRECVTFGPVCPQPPRLTDLVGDALPPQDEDCLYLNIWTTNAGGGAHQPVMVWIHGGGFNYGWSNQSAFEGSEFAKRGIVLVSVNYRLGPLGFLAHPALSAESSRDVSGNYGLLDTIAALEWVRKNIAAFGGDAQNVTIFGESAGGTMVNALCVSPHSKGLFHRAIAQSPGFVDGISYTHLRRPTRYSRSAEESGAAWASRLMEKESEEVLAALRAMSAEALIAKGGFQPKLVVDDWLILDFPENLFRDGKQHDISLTIGTNADEGTIFLDGHPYGTVSAYHQGIESRFGANAKEILALYPVSSDVDVPGALNALITDTWFLRGSTDWLRAMAKVSSPAYQYVFTRQSSAYPERGAYHSAELYYVFNTVHPHVKKTDDPQLAEAMIRYWVQFARTGNPNVEGLPTWPEYEPESARYLEFGEEIKTGSAYRHEALRILNRAR